MITMLAADNGFCLRCLDTMNRLCWERRQCFKQSLNVNASGALPTKGGVGHP